MKDFFNARQRFSIRKFSFGAASVLLGTVFLAQAPVAHADATTETEASTTTNATSDEDSATSASSTTASTDTDTTQATGTLEVKDVAPSATTAAETSATPAAEAAETTTTPADTSKLASQIAALEAAINKAPAGTDSAALTQAKVALAQAKSIQASTSASQAEVDAQAASLADMVTVVTEAASQANQAETESKEVAAEAAQPAEKTELEKTVSEAQVTNKLATDFVETEAPAKEVAVDLTNAVKSAVADNQAQVTAAQTVLADGNATTDAYQTAMSQLKSSIEAVYVSLRKAGKEDFAVALADTAGETGNTLDTDVASSDGLTTIRDENGVLVDKSQAADPAMSDAHGAKVEDKTPPTFNGTQLQPTSVEGRYTFQYMGLHWLDFALDDRTDPNEYYLRASRSIEESDSTVLLEMVKIADNSVLESHTLNSGDTNVAFTSLKSVSSNAYGRAYDILTGYDKTTAKDNSLGQILIYFAEYGGPYMMGSYDIPIVANYVTRYITEDGTPLADYTVKASADQLVTPSDVRDFTDYIIKETEYKGTPEINVDKLDITALDAENYGYKRLVRIIDAEGTAVKTLWIKDPTYTGTVTWDDADTTGFIKILETTEMKPGEVNTNLKLVTGQTMSNGEVFLTDAEAAEIEAKGTNYIVGDRNFGTANGVQIYVDPTDSTKHIEGAFVGNYPNVRPYGVTTGGKSFYLHNQFSKKTNWKLIPLENDVLFVSEAVHVYAEAASVVVNYVDQDGNVLTGTGTFTSDASKTLAVPAKNADGYQVQDQAKVAISEKTAYDTKDNRPDTITTATGEVYHLIGMQTGSDAENGTLDTKGRRVVTYKYQLATGDVNIHYVDTEGNVIAKEYKDVDDKPANVTDYNTAETTTPETGERPTTITVKNSDGTETVYYYKELSTDKSQSFYDNNTPNDTSDDVLAGETGKVQEGTTNVTYIYEKAGSVVVKYETTDGTALTGNLTFDDATTTTNVPTTGLPDEADAKPGTTYDTTDHKPTKITANGTVYYLVSKAVDGKYSANGVKAGSDAETGEVEADKTKEVTYVYEQAGNVTINYIATDGTVIKQPVKDVENGKPGDAYNAAETTTDNTGEKPATITLENGKKYKLVTTAGTTTGGDTKLTYDANGMVTATADGASTINNNPIGGQTGQVVSGKTTEVTYVYQEVKGDVVVKYKTTDGTQLSGDLKLDGATTATTVDATGVKVSINNETELSGGTAYDTASYKPTTIETTDGKKYELVKVAGETTDGTTYGADAVATGEGNASASGKVVAGETQTVTYLYEEVKGDVTVKYIDDQGNELAGTATMPDGKKETVTTDGIKVADQESLNEDYDTTTKKATRIVTADGKVYELAGDVKNDKVVAKDSVKDGSAAEKGQVAEETQNVTYVYKEVKGSVKVNYVDTEGNPISGTTEGISKKSVNTTEADVDAKGNPVTNVAPGTDYNTTDLKPETIVTADGKTYALVAENDGLKDGSAPESGKVQAGKTTEVTYVYQEVKGSVKVEYYDEDGEKITTDKPVVTDSSTGVDYDATTPEYRPETITTANGDVYYYKAVKSDSEPTSGKVTEGETVVKYVYEKAGSVTINYIATDGTVIKQPVKDVEDGKPGTAYDTTENSDSKEERPTVISTHGKVYRLVQTAGTTTTGVTYDENGVATGEGHYPTTGTVQAGLDKNVTYVYEEVKFGDVDVAYINTKGEKIADTETVLSGYEVGSNYTTTPKETITVTNTDGTTTTYRLVKQAGTTENGVSYDTNGVATGEGNAPATGEVTETKQTVTYVYEAVKGSVVVNYIDENGQPIAGTATGISKTVVEQSEKDVTDVPTGSKYDTTDLRPETITTTDGKVYKLLPALTKGNETGEVTEGTTTVTYVYQLQKGDVDVHYVNTDGKEIAPTVKDTDDADTGSAYNTTDHKPEKIVEDKTGDVYYYKEIAKDSATETGKVKEGTTNVTYVYEKAGNVVVNYVTTDGTVIKDPVNDVTNGKPGSDYNTTDNKPATITKDGKTYQLVEKNNGLKDGSAPESGTVEAGKTTEVTYVYQEVKTPEVKQGNVVVKYVTSDGTPLEGTLTADGKEITVPTTGIVDTPTSAVGTAYNTTDHKPATIVKDGKTYQLVPTATKGAETGEVVEGTTTVTYVYEEVKSPEVKQGNVVVENYDTKGNKLGDTTEVVKPSPEGTEYTTTPADKIESNGKTYYYKEVKSDSEPTSGKVKEGTTTVKYVYEEAGNVVVNYVTTDGTVIKDQVKDEINAKPGSGYNTTDNKPATITKDGKTYQLVEKNNGLQDGSAPESGTVETGKTTSITYVYEEVKTPEVKRGNVVVRYENEKGEVIKDPVNDETNVPEGTAYDTRDNKPTTITKDGKTYELVPSLTRGSETGNVEAGTTVITYVYREVVTPTPTDEKVTKFVEEGTNTVLSPDEKGNQPKKDITGYEFVKTITDESGNTIHVYRKVVTPTPTEEKVTKFVEEGTNTVLSPEEKGNQPKKDITGYEFVKTITDESGNTIHVYRKVVAPTPTEEKVTKFVEEGTNTVLSPDEKGNQPKKGITGYEFVKTITDESGNTIHVYRKVVTPTPTEEKVTKFVEEGTNTILSPDEKGNQPKKDITGYEFVKTITDESGNTIHVYRKVVTPTPQPTPNPQPTPQPEPTPVPQPEPQPKPTPTNVTPAHDAPVQPAAVVTPAQTSAPTPATGKQLPNTGTENHAGLAALGLAGLLGGLGLVSRKKKED